MFFGCVGRRNQRHLAFQFSLVDRRQSSKKHCWYPSNNRENARNSASRWQQPHCRTLQVMCKKGLSLMFILEVFLASLKVILMTSHGSLATLNLSLAYEHRYEPRLKMLEILAMTIWCSK